MTEIKGSRTNIFYAEDVRTVRKAKKAFLERNGYRVVLEAGSVAESLQLIPTGLEEKNVQAALIDGNFPDGTGSQIAEAIRVSGLGVSIFAFAGQPEIFGDDGLNFEKGTGDKSLIDALNLLFQPKIVEQKVPNVE